MGRPTKFKPEYCQKLIEHMKQGLSFESFSAIIGVNQDTLHEWSKNPKKYAGFLDAKKEAFAHARLFWEKLGIDGLYTTVTYDGENRKVEKSINATIWIFNMKNRFGWKDRVEFTDDDEIEDMEFIE